MQPQLLVVVVQPDEVVGTLIADALSASGHDPVLVSAASWATSLVRRDPPDVVLLERSAAGYERLLDALDDLDVSVRVLVTRFRDMPMSGRPVERAEAAAVVRVVEDAAWQRGPWLADHPPGWMV